MIHFQVLIKSLDDIWILSDSINFTKVHFFSSFYFGPSKSVIELVPYSLKHHSFQHWIGHPGLKLYGIRALSASSEMMILRMFKDQLFETPLVYSLFDPSIETVKKSTGLIAEGKYQDFTKLVQDSIIEFKMNPYQSKVIENFCASLNGSQYPITLVHGVFGSGKSYLVTVLIIILYRAFTSDYMLETTRIVLSSMTNVAVDRILLNLLELDFTDFVRVGSIRKIAKPILPFTCQFKSETHDLKELNEMHGAENLSVQDRLDIQKAIKKFQESDNRNLIVESFVIGITCLATNFDVLDGLINKLSKSNGLKMNAATVDSFQGSEKQIIILSTVRTRSSEFLEDPRRINVALTRGKCHLILLVSDSMYPRSNLWKGIMMRCSQPQVKPGVIDTTQLFEMLQD
ncbi:AAA domain-containing protein [Globomyces pollinis-pini]|nr:AAA domain-containing protein [Globomyces pollinis-pini]